MTIGQNTPPREWRFSILCTSSMPRYQIRNLNHAYVNWRRKAFRLLSTSEFSPANTPHAASLARVTRNTTTRLHHNRSLALNPRSTVYHIVSFFSTDTHAFRMASSPSVQADSGSQHSHPLSPALQSSTRRGRSKQNSVQDDDWKPKASYFTLKAQAELGNPLLEERSKREAENRPESSTRAYAHTNASQASIATTSTGQTNYDARTSTNYSRPKNGKTSLHNDTLRGIPIAEDGHFGIVTTSQVLSTKWHELSDEHITETLSHLATSKNDSAVSIYHSTIRALSSALESVIADRDGLQTSMRDREAALRYRANAFIDTLPFSDKSLARLTVDAMLLESESEEPAPTIKRTHKIVSMVRHLKFSSSVLILSQSLQQSLDEALEDNDNLKRFPTFDPAISSKNVTGSQPHSGVVSRSSLVADPEAESLLSRSAPNSIINVSSSKASPKWAGTWWGKDKTRSRPGIYIPTTSSLRTEDNPKSSPTAPSVTGESSTSLPAIRRKKQSKSVFGSLGFSIMNPTVPNSRRAVSDEQQRDVENANEGYSPELVPSELAQERIPETPSIQEPDDEHDNESTFSTTLSEGGDSRTPQATSLQAIINATRIMSSDPSSILIDSDNTGDLIARLAMELVCNARDQGLAIRGKVRERRRKVESTPLKLVTSDIFSDSGETRMAFAKSLSDHAPMKNKERRPSAPGGGMFVAPIGNFLAEQQRKINNAVGVVQKSAGIVSATKSQAIVSTPSSPQQSLQKPRAVALDSIIPDTAKPPTQYLSKRYVSLVAKDFRSSVQLSSIATRLTRRNSSGGEPLTDKYGFVYDVCQYDALLLKRAELCENASPCCLTGIRIADRHDDDEWIGSSTDPERTIEVVNGHCECDPEYDTTPDNTSVEGCNESNRSGFSSNKDNDDCPPLSRKASSISVRTRSGTVTAKSKVSLTAPLHPDSDSPAHVCEKRIRHMLHNLTDIHNRRQEAQTRAWDVFIRSRAKARSKTNANGAEHDLSPEDQDELKHNDGLIGFSGMGHSLSKDDRKELERLIRDGVPLQYRAKIWIECSGALEMTEPGVFHDLISASDPKGSVVREIEKDVGRTMPLNVFFGGDGAGIAKLRRVLIAYSG